MQADAQTLYEVFRHSYAASAEERKQAETWLAQAERSPGFLQALLQIAVEGRARPEIRQAASIQLKNQVKAWWAPVGENVGKGYSSAEKAEVRERLLDGVANTADAHSVQVQLVECFRLVALHDFPESWPGLVTRFAGALQSDSTVHTACGLLMLRKLFKQLEIRPVARRADMDSLCEQTLPALLRLGPALAAVAGQQSGHSLEAFEMLKLLLKCFYSSIHMAVGQCVQQEIQSWMELLLGLLALPATLPSLSEQAREDAAPAKCRKWIFHTLFRFFVRHGYPPRALDGMEEFAEAWSQKYRARVTEACLEEVCASATGKWVPSRSKSLALLCLAEGCGRAVSYEVMKPRLQQLLQHGLFPLVRFQREDMSLWREDPEEYVRQIFNEGDSFREPRAAAIDFIEKLLMYRSKEVLVPLLRFCCKHLEAQAQDPKNEELCADKDGALLLLGSIGSEIVSLDPSQTQKKKGKKKSSKNTDSSVSVAELLANHVRPELRGEVNFLRLRACWVYQKLAPSACFGPRGSVAAACRECLQLANDPELPIRVVACTCLQAFLEREGDEEEIQAAIGENLADVLVRLLRTMNEVSCEEVAQTLEALVNRFPKEIVPYAAQLIGQLAVQFMQCAGTEDEETGESAALSSMQTMVSVLQACASLQNPQDQAEKQQRSILFAGLAEPLLPLLSRLLKPDGIDYLEESLEMLTYLTFYSPSPLPPPLWALFPQLFQAVCGHPTPSLPLPEVLKDGWAPDFMTSLLPPLENFISRGPDVILAGSWAEAGLPYIDMVFMMVQKMLNLTGIGSEQDCSAAAMLGAALFENIPCPGVDGWLPRYFELLWSRAPAAETANLRRAILLTLVMMCWYNSELFLRCAEEKRCSQELFEFWMSRVQLLRSLSHRKVLVLALLRLLQLGLSNALPASLAPGLPHLVRQLADQTREIVRLRVKQASGEDDDEDEDDDDDDDEPVKNEKLKQVLAKLEMGQDKDEEEDDEDDEDFDEDNMVGGAALALLDEERNSPLDKIDELALLQQTLLQAPPQQVDAWLGVGGGRAQWLEALEQEQIRRRSAPK